MSNGCKRYRKSKEEVTEAGNKHEEKALALKGVAEEQKAKISSLREEKNSLLDKIDQLEFTEKHSSDLIIRMTRETRELKIQIRDIRKEEIVREEIIHEQAKKLEEVWR